MYTKVRVYDIKNGTTCTTTQMRWLNDILVTNPMRDAVIEFLKAILSAQKSCTFLAWKTTKNSKIIISLQILPIFPIKNPWVSINFQKFAKKCEKTM